MWYLETDDQTLLQDILQGERLAALFQPIVDLGSATIHGYEGLIRGPSDSPLHTPLSLLRVATDCGRRGELEALCHKVLSRSFAQQSLPGLLFLNISPDVMVQRSLNHAQPGMSLDPLVQDSQGIVFELTEGERYLDYGPEILQEGVSRCLQEGIAVAIDDLGEGFSSLRLWSELRPTYVKVDRHFVQNIENDPVKAQFVKSIVEIARQTQSKVIAEGIETVSELLIVRNLGVTLGQGYLFSRPHATPLIKLDDELVRLLQGAAPRVADQMAHTLGAHNTLEARHVVQKVEPVSSVMTNEWVLDWFESHPAQDVVPLVNQGGLPVGLINRGELMGHFAQPYRRELYGKKSCTHYADMHPLIVDKFATVQEISQLLGQAERRHFQQGFIVTDQGRYHGLAHGQDLMRVITEMQIQAAKYANPLTQLPGNVPIHEHLDGLLRNKTRFCACYFDLDNFKPYNDVYGFSAGDGVIRMTAEILRGICDHDLDFLGHIGGDDFIVLFRSSDWESRCNRALSEFERLRGEYFTAEDLAAQGYYTENRQFVREFHQLVSLSIGAVVVPPGRFSSYMEVSRLASGAKKQAKQISGNSLFINRRYDREMGNGEQE
ncbi:MAG: GGDEF domain-containing protein [Ferrovum sp.]|nr:GGDEF domain-containing protein [Ferrovum sp.]NDU87033.1 GGDEF domain-containing protein [Ferrovum sp.]